LPANPTDADRERLRQETIDPFLRNRPRKGVPKKVWLALPVVLVAAWVMQLFSLGIDAATQSWKLHGVDPAHYDYSVSAMIYAMLFPVYEQSQYIFNAVNIYTTFIVSVLLSIIGLVLNFASDRITENVTSLIFRDPFVIGGMAVALGICISSLWNYETVGDAYCAHSSVFLQVLFTTSALVLLFPYITYLFLFLDIEDVVTRFMTSGLNSVISCVNNGADLAATERNQVNAATCIEDLMDAAISGIKKRSSGRTSEIIDALCSFSMHYVAIKDRASEAWFTIPTWMRQSPDYVFLSDAALDDMRRRGLWVEWKILRQFQYLFVEAIRDLKEMCYHICINTRIIAETAIDHNQVELVDLTLKFFNTYLRTAINAKDFRVIYNTLFQYR
jgi:hypothetical protein